MNDPFDNDRVNREEKETRLSGPQNRTEWQGSNYRYSSTQGTWSYRPYAAPVQPAPPKSGKGKKRLVKALAGVLACLMISVGSVAGFVALVNGGYVKLSSSGSSPAFTINKVEGSNVTTTTVSGQLTLQEVAQKVLPSVVYIQNYQKSQNRFQEEGANENGESLNGEGSGIIATADGYIITNAHVVSGADSLKVMLTSGKTYEAKVVGSDSVTDLAVVKIDAAGLPAATFGSSDDLKVADTVMAIGNPGGSEFKSTVTIGYVSALNRTITNSDTGFTLKCIQTDAAINPGNSGGALVNMYGQVVGINSSKIVATGFEGLGFAIPVSTAQPIISDLKEYGYVKDRAALGVSGQFVDSMSARFYNLPVGMYVASVTNPAVTSAGIQKGDVITKIDGQEISSQNTITAAVSAKKPGETVTLSVERPLSGETFNATVKLAQASGK